MNSKFSTKQAFLFTLINYFGVAIGMFSTLFIYPLDLELLGIFRFVDGFAQILYPIMVLGASTALMNFQPMLTALLQRKLFSYSMASIFWMIVFCGIFLYLTYYFDWYRNSEYFIYSFAIAICLGFVDLFKRQSTNLQKIAVPTFFEKIIPKLALPLVFVCVLYFSSSTTDALVYYTISFLFILVAVGWYLFSFFKPDFSFHFKDLFEKIPKKDYYKFSLYAFSASIGSFFAFRIDSIMIPAYLDMEANGTFNIGVNLANALMIPATGVFALYSPIISENLKMNKLDLLRTKYVEVAKNLFFIGAILYGSVLIGMEPFFNLLPTSNGLLDSVTVIYILGLSVLMNMATGFNTEIIAYSKFYRFNLIAILSLAVINVSLNIFLLTFTDFGIVGVAIASLIATFIFNLIKLIFIYKKFNLIPFDASYVKLFLLIITFLAFFKFLPIPFLGNYAFFISCLLYVFTLLFVVYKVRWVPQLNIFVNQMINKWF